MKIYKTNDTTKKRKMLIVFDGMIVDTEANKKLSLVLTELFLRGRNLNISLIFISQSYFKVPKTIRLNTTPYFIIKIPNKRELQQIPLKNLAEVVFKDLKKLSKYYTKELLQFY